MESGPEFASILRSSGNRLTGPRRAVWDVLQNADRHLTAEEIAVQVHRHDPAVNLASVYRTLALFSDLELVRESTLGSGEAARWELAHPDEHFHLVCSSCGSVDHHVGTLVSDVSDHVSGDHGFVVHNIELVVTGLCRACAAPT